MYARLQTQGHVIALFLTCGSACLGNDGTSSSDSRVFFTEGLIWRTHNLEVCWADSASNDVKGWVMDAMRGQRSWGAAGNLNLMGWNDCGNDLADILIVPQDAYRIHLNLRIPRVARHLRVRT